MKSQSGNQQELATWVIFTAVVLNLALIPTLLLPVAYPDLIKSALFIIIPICLLLIVGVWDGFLISKIMKNQKDKDARRTENGHE